MKSSIGFQPVDTVMMPVLLLIDQAVIK